MPRTIRFHLDENCSHAIAAGLRRRGIDVTTTPDVGLLGAVDEDQLAYCLAESRVIFSSDDQRKVGRPSLRFSVPLSLGSLPPGRLPLSLDDPTDYAKKRMRPE